LKRLKEFVLMLTAVLVLQLYGCSVIASQKVEAVKEVQKDARHAVYCA
jgi:hypothetical protein